MFYLAKSFMYWAITLGLLSVGLVDYKISSIIYFQIQFSYVYLFFMVVFIFKFRDRSDAGASNGNDRRCK